MKRSEINKIVDKAVEFLDEMKYILPPFTYWDKSQWENKNSEYDEIKDNMLGWDITDFGSGDFLKIGLLLFTVRNGNLENSKYIKPYAEKILIVEENQVTPYHYHYNKMEDIINRGGGNLIVKVYNKDENDKFADIPVLT